MPVAVPLDGVGRSGSSFDRPELELTSRWLDSMLR